MNNLVSIIMPVFNGENYIQSSINSLINQTYTNLEIIVINDGSNDTTSEILAENRSKDSRIKIYTNEVNIGLTKSLNIAINKATGKYIARQDVDDISCLHRIERQVKALEFMDLDLVLTLAKNSQSDVIPSKKIRYLNTFNVMYLGNIWVHGTFLGKANLFKEYLYDESYKYAQDYNFLLRVLLNHKKIMYLNEVLYYLNSSETNRISNLKKNEQLEFANRSLIEVMKFNPYLINKFKVKNIVSKLIYFFAIAIYLKASKENLGKMKKIKF